MNGRLSILCALLLLVVGGCETIPRPFQPGYKPRPLPAQIQADPRQGLVVDAVEGWPDTLPPLHPYLAKHLQAQEILAHTGRGHSKSFRLQTVLRESVNAGARVQLNLAFALIGPDGENSGNWQEPAEIAAGAWRSGDPEAAFDDLAYALAPRLAGAIVGDGAVIPDYKPVRLFVNAVQGAEGDGNQRLRLAMVNALAARRLGLADRAEAATHLVAGRVTTTPIDGAQENVAIRWDVIRNQGDHIGDIRQQNAVKRGSLRGPWGAIADVVAAAAADGIADLLRATGDAHPPARATE